MIGDPADRVGRADPDDSGLEAALRMILAIAFRCHEAARLVRGFVREDAGVLWPSTVYHGLARQMLATPGGWARGAMGLDQRLSPWTGRFRERPAVELVEALRSHEVWDAHELAALLWVLVRRREPLLNSMVGRLTREVQVAVCRLAAHPTAQEGQLSPTEQATRDADPDHSGLLAIAAGG